jgi:hypothetical protein
LKEAYGESFVLTEDQFFDKITNDPAYQEKIYGIFKDVYKDDFILNPKQFYDKLKKKESGTENLQVPAQLGGKAFTLSTEEVEPPKKKPYQDISYKKEALQTDAVSNLVPNQIQQTVKATGKVAAVTNPRVIQDKATEAVFDIVTKSDPVQKSLFDYEVQSGEYERLNKLNGASEREVIDNIRRYDPDLWKELSQGITDNMVGSGGLGENLSINDFRTASKAVYERYKALLESTKDKLSDSTNKANVQIDEIVKSSINENNFKDYIKSAVKVNQEVATIDGRSVSAPKTLDIGEYTVDIDKIDDLATEIVKSYDFVDDGGKAWQNIFNKLKIEAEHYIIDEKANAKLQKNEPELYAKWNKLKEESAKISGMTPEQFADYWKDDDMIAARYENLAKSLSDQYIKDAQMEAAAFMSDYTYNSDKLKAEYDNKKNDVSAKADKLAEMYRLGNIDQLTYTAAIDQLDIEMAEAYDKYEKAFQGLEPYIKSANEVYSRYNSKIRMELEMLQEKADKEMSQALDQYLLSFEDPQLIADIKSKYNTAYKEAAFERKEAIGDSVYNYSGPLGTFLRSTKGALGGVIGGYGGYFNSKLLKVLGETVASDNIMPEARSKEFSDLLDMQNFTNLSGQLAGSMAPGMVATGIVTAATGAAGAPAAVQLVVGGFTGWLTESMDIAGRAYNDMFEKTGGDVQKASEAFRASFNSQYDLMGLYAFDALPFVGDALSKIASKAKRVAVGAGAEYVTEGAQEFHQNIAEENISEGRDAWEGYGKKLFDPNRHKENAIMLAPTLIMGGIGQLRSKGPTETAAAAYDAIDQKTKLNPAFRDQERQYIQNLVFERNTDFAKGVISSLFASGKINEEKATDMIIEVERAQRVKDTSDAAKLKGDQRLVYSFFTARAEDADRNARIFHEDPIMSKVFEQQAKDYQQAGIDFLNGKKPELYSITYADGSQNLMTQSDMADIMDNEEALDVISGGNIQISSYGSQTGSNSLDLLREKVATYQENKKVTEEKKVSGGNYNNTIDVLEAIKNDQDYKGKITDHPAWETLTAEEKDQVVLLSEKLSRYEREMKAVTSVGVESTSLEEKIKTAQQDISNILNQEPDDNKNIPGVSSEIGEGQKPLEEEPVESTSEEETPAGGVLQTQEGIEAKRADIERRRQEELNALKNKELESVKRSTKGTPINKDNPGSFKVGQKYSDGMLVVVQDAQAADDYDPNIAENDGDGYTIIDRVIEYGEMKDGKQSKAPVVRLKTFNNKADADAYLDNQKQKFDNQIGKSPQYAKVNAKYDAELAALEAPQTEAAPEVTTETAPTEKKKTTKPKAEKKPEKPKRQQVEESLKKLRDQGLLVTADTSLLAKAKKLVGKKPKLVPMSDKEIAAQMKLLDAMAKVWKNVTGQDNYYDEFINEVKKGDLKKLQDMGGVLYQEEGDDALAMPFKARVSLSMFNLPPFKAMEGKVVSAQNVKDMVKTKAKQRGEKPILDMVLNSPKYKDKNKFSFDEFKSDVELAVLNFERHYTPSYSTYGMNYMGKNQQQYGEANTIVFNAPINHGYSGHWDNIYDPVKFSKRNWILREIPNSTGTFVAWDSDAPAGVPQDELMNYIGTAGPREQVEAWIKDIKDIGTDKGKVKVGLFGHIRAWQNKETGKFFVAELQSDTHQKYQKTFSRPLEQAFVPELGMEGTSNYIKNVFYPAVMNENINAVLDEILNEANVIKGENGYEIGVPNDEGGFDFKQIISFDDLNIIAEATEKAFFSGDDMLKHIRNNYDNLDDRGPLRDKIYPLAVARILSDESELMPPGPMYPNGAFIFGRNAGAPSRLSIDYDAYVTPVVIRFDSENQYAQFKNWTNGIIHKGIRPIRAGGRGKSSVLIDRSLYTKMTMAATEIINGVHKKTNLDKYAKEVAKTETDALMAIGGFNYEKQFLDLDKNYMTRLFRESIRLAAESGAETMLIPYPRTLALIEKYIGQEETTNTDTDREIPYETPDGSDSDLDAGDIITYEGERYRVVFADSRNIKVAREDRVYHVNYYEDVRERAYSDANDLQYELRRALKDAELGFPNIETLEITQEHIDVFKEHEDILMYGSTAARIMQKAIDNDPTIEEVEDEDGIIEEKRYITWSDVEDAIIDEIDDNIHSWGIEDFYGDQQVFQDGDYVYLVDYGADVEEFYQPDQYEEKPKEPDNIADIAERDYYFEENYKSDFQKDQATVIGKYVGFKDDFRKLRPDAKTYVDENSNLWLETQITPEDLNNPIVAFQKEGERAKAAIDFMTDQKATVHIFKGADISSLAHEMTGHIGRRVLERLAAQNADFAKDYEAAKKWSGVKGDFWHTAAEEKFARGFERYLRAGKAPNKSLQSVFNKLREWFSNIYEQIKGGSIDVNITPRMKRVFDNLLSYKPEPKVETQKTKAETKPEEVKRKPKQEILNKAKRLAELYREIKSGNVSIRPELDDLLEQNPKLNYLYKNLPDINAKLEKDGLITKKTDGCP